MILFYVSVAHHSKNVMEDAVLAFPLLEIAGVMIFNDYMIGVNPYALTIDLPKAGIDAFLKIYAGRYTVLLQYSGSQQVVIQKLTE